MRCMCVCECNRSTAHKLQRLERTMHTKENLRSWVAAKCIHYCIYSEHFFLPANKRWHAARCTKTIGGLWQSGDNEAHPAIIVFRMLCVRWIQRNCLPRDFFFAKIYENERNTLVQSIHFIYVHIQMIRTILLPYSMEETYCVFV